MLIKITNLLVRFHLVFVAEFMLSLLSFVHGKNARFKYSQGLWILTDKNNKKYVNYFIDPRTNFENDWLDLYRDIFLHQFKPMENDIVVIIGANLGHELLVFNDSMKNTGKILCVEALPVLMPGLKMTIQNNNLTNCKTFNFAIGKQDNTFIEFSNRVENNLARSIYDNQGDEIVEVPVITMDTFCKNESLNIIDCLYVNIEGAEVDLIEGFQSIDIVRKISISCHDFLFKRDPSIESSLVCTFDRIKEFLISNNFEIYTRNTGEDYKDFYIYGINKSITKN
jgi:FkbM family methyltransferase